ncbi:hypothetical protein ZWY2020_058502 [Hordeum vulgare]|nr:hypothetical protein ZWY2020_058502 [Hordeum vulgare]
MVTVQKVASDDKKFVINFAAEGDQRFVLKAQRCHYKRDGIIFAEFDDKGDPVKVDVGVMAIWAQARDLPFELKTESMGWMLEDQLGEVLDVSHRNFVTVGKFLRVRVAILLHEPLKTTLEFTPLGSSKKDTFDVRYGKLPLYSECCGIVGHSSERFSNIPRENRIASYPKNLSVESYWKAQGASKRALSFGNMSRGEKRQVAGADYNKSASAMEDIFVKVATAVSGLTVCDKEVVASTSLVDGVMEATRQANPMLDQEGRVLGSVRRTGQWCLLLLPALARRARE